MPSQNLVSAVISPEVKEDIILKLGEVKQQLNFLLTLQTDEIKALLKASNSSFPFIDRAYSAVNDHPEIMPAVFDIEEFRRDCELANDLTLIANQVNELAESIDNTLLAANSDAMTGALEIYAAVKQNRDKVPGLNVIADEMKVFFKRTRRNKEE